MAEEHPPAKAARKDFRHAVLVAYAAELGLSYNRTKTWEMLALVAERGLPSRAEREAVVAERRARAEDPDAGRVIGRSCKVK